MENERNIKMWINIYLNDIGRTPEGADFLAAAWKAAKVLVPLVGALIEPTIPVHIVNIKDWDTMQQFYQKHNEETAKVACRRTK